MPDNPNNLEDDLLPSEHTGLSMRSIRIGRTIDRLPPGGEYHITLTKPPDKVTPWNIEISSGTKIMSKEID